MRLLPKDGDAVRSPGGGGVDAAESVWLEGTCLPRNHKSHFIHPFSIIENNWVLGYIPFRSLSHKHTPLEEEDDLEDFERLDDW